MNVYVHQHKIGKTAYISDKGSVRENNQDYLGVLDKENQAILAVADGLGGHNAGEIASKVAIEKSLALLKEIDEIFPNDKKLKDIFDECNTEIFNISKEDKKFEGMGTTLTLSVIDKEHVIIAHVGDSSCYFIRKSEITKVTKDHSLVQELVDLGIITEREAQVHPQKNVITRALGISEKVEIDTYKFDITNVSHIVLCSDGLSNVVEEEILLDIILNNNINEACELLYKKGIDNGSRDNISIMIFEGEC